MAEKHSDERAGELMAVAEHVFGNRAKAERWMGRWNRSLGAIPAELGRTEDGARRVLAILSAIAHGDVA